MVPTQHSALRGAFEWIAVIAIALVATFLIRTFVVEPFVVPTGSMEDTIEIGDQILAQKVSLELVSPSSRAISLCFTTLMAPPSMMFLSSALLPRPARRSTCRTARWSLTARRSTRTTRPA